MEIISSADTSLSIAAEEVCHRKRTLTYPHYTHGRCRVLPKRFVRYLCLVLFSLLLFGPSTSCTRVNGFDFVHHSHSYRSVSGATSCGCVRLHNKPSTNRRRSFLLTAAPPSGDEGQQHTKKNVRLQVFQVLSNPAVEVVGFALVLLSSLLVALDTIQDLPPLFYTTIDDGLLLINLILALDFFLRWYAAGQFKAIYLTKPLVVLDVVVVLAPLILGSAMLPLLNYWGFDIHDRSNSSQQAAILSFLYGIQNSAGLQNLLLLRVLRLRRILTDITTFGKFAVVLGLKPQDIRPYQLQLARVFLSILTLLSVASGLIYTAEHQVNPAIPDYFAALYFGLTTLTTVGLGDISPITPQGRLVVCGSILLGVTIIPVQTAKLVDIFVESQKDEQRRKLVATGRKRMQQTTRYSNNNPGPLTRRATNGLGPSGIAIEVPVREDHPRDLAGANTRTRIQASRICGNCAASPHRSEAAFCWSCGTPLPLSELVATENRMTDDDMYDDETSLS